MPAAEALWEARELLGLRRYAEAAEAARRALSEEPDNVPASVVLAAALIDGDRPSEGLDVAQQLLARQPDRADIENLAGVALYRLQRYDDADRHLNRSLSLDPGSATPHVWLTESLLKRSTTVAARLLPGSSILRRARHHADECVRLEPNGSIGHLLRAKVALAERHWDEATSHAKRALAIEPEHPVGHQLLGLAAAGQGRTGEAADHFVAAGKLNPRSDASTRMLRSLRSGLPFGFIGLFVLIRVIGVSGAVLGPLVAVLIALVAFGAWYWRRWDARRRMSAEARQALDRDRKLRRGVRWRG